MLQGGQGFLQILQVERRTLINRALVCLALNCREEIHHCALVIACKSTRQGELPVHFRASCELFWPLHGFTAARALASTAFWPHAAPRQLRVGHGGGAELGRSRRGTY